MLKNRGDTWTFSALYIIIKKVRKTQNKKKAVVSPLQCDMTIIYNNMSVTCGRPMLKKRGDTWTFRGPTHARLNN